MLTIESIIKNLTHKTTETETHTLYVGFLMETNRYAFDFNLSSTWQQFDTDQDFSGFGIWTNSKKLTILNFCEGDLYLTIYKTKSSYKEELKRLAERYPNKTNPWMTTYSFTDDGVQVEEFFAPRPT